ncbi:hypothetical protein AJ80_08573 [Polytolypa hystricis UAMH7299]|uniref:Transmembrane protein UsgS n=1 Tax=Polytolypa hystricis (strain UAMH7299) TaxID=1447883 RepID=A0A2B7X5Q5_POLH7|nr:hypothetical protein AJ80_08573 [Polytolypa hystricis UAMH7299]
MSSFEPDAIIRGAQLTFVGAYRALQNPALFKSEHYRQALVALLAGILIHLVLSIPILIVKSAFWILSFFLDLKNATWDDHFLDKLDFISTNVLQIPFLLMTLMRYLTPTLDDLFMESLRWVDSTYTRKHSLDDPRTLRALYYPNLRVYPARRISTKLRALPASLKSHLTRYMRRALLSLAVYLLSLLPVVGRFVIPLASFYTFNQAVGMGPAAVVFASGLVLPKRVLVVFLQSYFASRSLMRELLQPYFLRLNFTPAQKRRWFHDRSGVLFGFALAFYILSRPQPFGVLVYGIAQASTAYLVTKITDPPPPPPPPQQQQQQQDKVNAEEEMREWTEGQVKWRSKKEFLGLEWKTLDRLNVKAVNRREDEKGDGEQGSGEGDAELRRKFS